MMKFRWNSNLLALAATGILAASLGCGGDGGGGGSGSSSIGGNVSAVNTARASDSRSWLARIATDVVGLARKAYAQATGLDGIEVSAGRNSDVTDAAGNFDVGAPTGDVTVHFENEDCDADVTLPDVADGSALTLEDVSFACGNARATRIAESFEAIVRNKPGSPQGNLNVCVATDSGFRTRVVKIKDADFEGGTFEDLEEGDRIAVAGIREGQGLPSALDAELVTLLGPSGVPCEGEVIPTVTPESTETPDGTETPDATETPEPTNTPEATPTS